MTIIKAGADVNYVDQNQCSVLMWAARKKSSIEVFKSLIEAGADTGFLDTEGRSCLAWGFRALLDS